MASRRILCETLDELLGALREHAEKHEGFELADDATEKHFGFQCTKCGVWWSAPVTSRFQSSATSKAHFESLKSRQALLLNLGAIYERVHQFEKMYSMAVIYEPPQALRQAASPPKPKKPPETVFDHLMGDDEGS